MRASAVQTSTVAPQAPSAEQPAGNHGFSFHDLLSILNPLQYLPVVGTLYRAATGDVIPEAARVTGSLIASGVLGGPIGLLTNIAVTLGEKASGIDPDTLVAGIFHKAPPTPAPGSPPTPSAFSPQDLVTYGIPSGTAWSDNCADTLNAAELVRLGHAAAAYAATQTLTRPAIGG